MILKLLLVFCLVVCQAMDKHLICKDVNNVFTPAERILPPRHGSVRGFPGKAGPEGPRGIKGETGAPGAKAIVDYDRINAEIDEKIQPVTSGLGNLEQACEAKMKNLTSKMKTESDGFYSVVSKLNGSLSNETAKIESKLERFNAAMEKMTSGLSNLEKTNNAKIENLSSKMETAIGSLTTKLENSLETKMQNLKAELISRMENLVQSTSASNLLVLYKQQGLCDVQHNNSCFWAIVHNNEDVTYAEAERLCRKSGGQVADIYNQQHYDSVLKYIRTKIPSSRNHAYFWIATKYNPMTGVTTARNGGQAFVKWEPGAHWVLSGSSGASWSSRTKTAIWIYVRRRPTSIAQGMSKSWPTILISGAVCEI